MRKFEPISLIKANHPAVKGYILEPPAGPRIILKPDDVEPEGRFCLVGIIER